MCLSQPATNSLLLLADSLYALNGYPVRNESTFTRLSSFLDNLDPAQDQALFGAPSDPVIVASDASSQALCVYDVQNARGLFHQAVFSSHKVGLASGHRELIAVKLALQSVPQAFSDGTSVFWLTDSSNLVAFLTKGSSKRHIQDTVVDIYHLT